MIYLGDPDDQLDTTNSERDGLFRVYGETREINNIEPYIIFKHNCFNGKIDTVSLNK